MKYALIIGINSYESSDITDLQGCEHDAQDVKNQLEKDFADSIEIKCLLSKQATRENIIQGFRKHLAQAQKGELALFYFSGHGSREPSPEEFWPYQPDRKHENIVCHDSEMGAEDIADKELQLLISELAERGIRVVLILDCCHSGSGTRSKFKEAFRMTRDKESSRAREDFLPGVFERLGKRKPKHLLMAACAPKQLSRERYIPIKERHGGLFTNAMLEVLKQTSQPGLISYANLGSFCAAWLKRRVKNDQQTPKIEAIGGFDANHLFLQTHNEKRNVNVYPLKMGEDSYWKIELGRIHGLLGDSAARFAVYTDTEMTNFVGEALTRDIGLFESKVKLPHGFNPIRSTPLWVPATYLPMERLNIFVPEKHLERIMHEVCQLQDAREFTGNSSQIPITKQEVSSTIHFTSKKEMAIVGLELEKEHFRLFYTETDEAIFPHIHLPLKNHGISTFPRIASALIQLAKWERIRKLENPTSSIQSEENAIELLSYNSHHGKTQSKENITVDIDTSYTLDEEGNPEYTHEVDYSLNIKSKANAFLNMLCCYLSPYYQVETINDFPVPNDTIPRVLDEDIQLYIPIHKNPSQNQVTDLYKIILSKQEIPFLNLDIPNKLEEKLIINRDRLEGNSKNRRRSSPKKSKEAWLAKTVKIKLLRQIAELGTDNTNLLNGRLRINGHKNFRAKVSFSSSAEYMNGPLSDRFMNQKLKPEGVKLLDITGFKQLETNLEIHHIQERQSLQEAPLNIDIYLEESGLDELWAISLPESLNAPTEGIESKPGEVLTTAFPILGKAKRQDIGHFHFELDNLPQNPDDGRTEPENSCKISFISVSRENKRNLEALEIISLTQQPYIGIFKVKVEEMT